MQFDILGPTVVRDPDGREIRLPAGRERSLLALLLIHRGDVVAVDRIVEALWGAHPPGTAAKAVQGYVSHLRRVLDPDHDAGGSDGLLRTRPPGYSLRLDGLSVDATRFERLAAEAGRALEDGAAPEAAAALGEALGLWRGPALADFAFDDFAQPETHRLEELRLIAVENRAEALLRLGRHAEVVSEIASVVVEHPLRERLRGHLMLALYRSGRQADALQVYHDGRRLLQGELGLDPGPELRRLEQAILAQDPALDAPAPPPPPVPATEREAQPAFPSEPRSGWRRVAIAGALLSAIAVAVALALVLARDDEGVVAPAVVVVDPKTNDVVASITAGSKPVAIAAGEGAIWVGDARDGTVTRIDPVSRKVVVIGIGAPAVDLATGSGSVWVATGGFGEVVRIDPGLGAIADRIELGNSSDLIVPAVSSIGVGEGRVWVGAFDGLLRLDPDSREPTGRRVDLGGSAALQIAVARGAVWATTLASRAKRVEASSAQVTAQFYAGAVVFPIAVDRKAVWVGGVEHGQLWKLDSITGATIVTSRVGSAPSGIAIGGGGVWVAIPDDQAVVKVDPATGEERARIPVGGAAEDVVFADGLVWVAVQAVS